MRLKVCHGQCEHCGHTDVQDLDLQIHQSPDGQFSMAFTCRDQAACTLILKHRQAVAHAGQ